MHRLHAERKQRCHTVKVVTAEMATLYSDAFF